MANNVNPVILSALELEVHFGEQVILDKASLTVHEGDRIGLVGRNGAGKSTFLKIISGLLQPDSGEVAARKDVVIGFLSQEFTLDDTKNVRENIMDGAQIILKLIREYEETPFDSPRKTVLEQEILRIDGWDLEKRVNILIKSLDAPPGDRDIRTLSGGEKRRTALCRALISNPDLLILDEPTNHLDTKSIEWIENFLAGYKGTCIFVTHDRYFLDRIANRIVELANGTFYSHQGNYTAYLENKSERLAVQEVEEKKRQNFLRRELDWVKRGPRARRTKAKSRLNNYYEVAAQEKAESDLDVDLIIPEPERLGKKVLDLKSVEVKFGGRILFDKLNLNFEHGRKLGVIGSNGAGKTTLLRVLLGELHPSKGKIETGERTEFNYVDQHRLLLNEEDTVFQAIGEGNETVTFGKQKMNVWTYLRRFLFTDDRINTLVGRLSGGEKSRLTLAKILMSGGNFLLLDEPTNDLDLPTLRILEEALIGFEGCVVVVSHDRYFLNRVCNGILAFEEDGGLYFSEGDYDYYLDKKREREKSAAQNDIKIDEKPKREKPKIRKLTYNEKVELEAIENRILETEAEIERIEGLFASPDYYEKYAEQTVEFNERLAGAKKHAQELYARWQELEDIKNNAAK